MLRIGARLQLLTVIREETHSAICSEDIAINPTLV